MTHFNISPPFFLLLVVVAVVVVVVVVGVVIIEVVCGQSHILNLVQQLNTPAINTGS